MKQISRIFVVPVFVQYFFDNQHIWVRHLNQRNHNGLVNGIVEECSIIEGEVFDFDSSEQMSVETHQSVFFVLEVISESFGFEVKIIEILAFS